MGTWDTSLYGGDLPLDIKDKDYEQLYERHTSEDAAALVWKELQRSVSYNAGYIVCFEYEVPANTKNEANITPKNSCSQFFYKYFNI